jgi:cytochrome c-type biogenesis protein CcmH
MEPGGVDWLPALVALGVGLVFGGFYVWRMRTSGPAAPAPEVPIAQRDLQGKRDVLLRQLVELDDAAAKRSPEQLARERYALELDTARVLQELDGISDDEEEVAEATVPTPRESTAPPPAGRPALRGFLWATGTMAALAGLVFFVTQAARPRQPGGSPTGDLPGMSSPAPTDPEEARIRARLQQDPDDLDARLALARSLLVRQDMMGVWSETQYVLERSPGHPRALSYQALVRLAMGQADVALQMLEQVIASDPDVIDAYAPLSVVLTQLGRPEDAARIMAEARRRFPQRAEALTQLEARLASARAGGDVSGEENPHATVPMPAGGGGSSRLPERAASQGSPNAVGGSLDLDPALRGQVTGGVLFVIVREAGVEAGPPLAVQRIVPTSFPLRFEIGQDDSMTGDSLPEEVRVEARLDSDGDPSTRPPTDPRAGADPVPLGTSDLALVLRRES